MKRVRSLSSDVSMTEPAPKRPPWQQGAIGYWGNISFVHPGGDADGTVPLFTSNISRWNQASPTIFQLLAGSAGVSATTILSTLAADAGLVALAGGLGALGMLTGVIAFGMVGQQITNEQYQDIMRYLPTYGLYGGPKWSAGLWSPSAHAAYNTSALDVLDLVFKDHDLRYYVAKDRNDIIKADQLCVAELEKLQQEGKLTSQDQQFYAAAAKQLFTAKLVAEKDLNLSIYEPTMTEDLKQNPQLLKTITNYTYLREKGVDETNALNAADPTSMNVFTLPPDIRALLPYPFEGNLPMDPKAPFDPSITDSTKPNVRPDLPKTIDSTSLTGGDSTSSMGREIYYSINSTGDRFNTIAYPAPTVDVQFQYSSSSRVVPGPSYNSFSRPERNISLFRSISSAYPTPRSFRIYRF